MKLDFELLLFRVILISGVIRINHKLLQNVKHKQWWATPMQTKLKLTEILEMKFSWAYIKGFLSQFL